MTAKRMVFWAVLLIAGTMAANAKAAVLTFNFGTTSPFDTSEPLTASNFSFYGDGPFSFGKSEISALLTDTGGDGATLTATLVEARVNGVDLGLDLSFDCFVAAGAGSATCTDNASAPISVPAQASISLTFFFTLSPLDHVDFTSLLEVSNDQPLVVPEPGAIVLLSTALTGLVLYRRRRRA